MQRGEQPGVAACVPGLVMMYGPRRGHTGEKRERRERRERRSSKLGPDPDPTLSDAASFVMILAENIFSALKD